MRERIAIINKNRIVANNACPCADAGKHALEGADCDRIFDAPIKVCADQAFISVVCTDWQTPFGVELGHARGVPVPPGDLSMAFSP